MFLLVAALIACSSGADRRDSVASGATTAPAQPASAAVESVSPRPETTATAPAPASQTERKTRPAIEHDTARRDTSHGAAMDADREIARAVAAWNRVRTLRAAFEQTVTNPLTGSKVVAKGNLQQQKPAKLAITFTDPLGDRIVSDGQYVWVYLQSATPGQVVRMRVTDVGAANTDLIGQFLNTPRAKYDATDAGPDSVGSRPARAIVLMAKQGESLPFIRAKVWVDNADALIRQFEALDANGVTRHVRIISMSPNASVDASAFQFEVPAGVRIIER